MVHKFNAEINKVYFITTHTLVHIIEGSGHIQVDFKAYYDWEDKVIYLEEGQYIKFLSDNFTVRFIHFPDEALFKSEDVRILFKHLISIGYINFKECEDCQRFLNTTIFNGHMTGLLDASTAQWYWQNPFSANRDEYQIIFDIKDIIDEQFANNISIPALLSHIGEAEYDAQHLIKHKLGVTIKKLLMDKRLKESKKDIAFTDRSIKEIAYDQGYQDPAYFNKSFKAKTGQTPKQFRENFDYTHRDQFMQDVTALIQLHHKEAHELGFYADKMNLTVKTLSQKVKQKLNTSLGKLIRMQIIQSAKQLLPESNTIKEVAYTLGFDEPQHFTTFFTHYTGTSPSVYKNKMYNK